MSAKPPGPRPTALPSFRFPPGLTAARFMREYWQKKPLLLRAAFQASIDPIGVDGLFDLARRDDVEARLVEHGPRGWALRHAPFETLPDPERKPGRGRSWTILVQGVNLHNDAADALLRQFAFISAARLDDLMISYATDGGGVGPHFDSYDVFLLQTHGQRRWRIGRNRDAALVPDVPLRILANFVPEAEWVLEPGDMLYLPPHYAHEGTAVGPCMTASIGFRAPTNTELAGEFLHALADELDLPGRYEDPDRRPTRTPARIDDPLVEHLAQQLERVRWGRAELSAFLASYLSEPKPQTFFDPPDRPLPPARLQAQAARRGLRLHRKTTILYTPRTLCINGEIVPAPRTLHAVLRTLGDQRQWSAAVCAARLTDALLLELVHDWYAAGWLELGAA